MAELSHLWVIFNNFSIFLWILFLNSLYFHCLQINFGYKVGRFYLYNILTPDQIKYISFILIFTTRYFHFNVLYWYESMAWRITWRLDEAWEYSWYAWSEINIMRYSNSHILVSKTILEDFLKNYKQQTRLQYQIKLINYLLD